MSGFTNIRRRVTDPLHDRVKARIFGEPAGGYFSSGSEHSAHADDDMVDSSPSLSDLVNGFLVDESGSAADQSQERDPDDSDSDRDGSSSSMYDLSDAFDDLRSIIVAGNADAFKNALSAHVYKALQVFSSLKLDKPILRRNVMGYLRNFGYNAAICKTKWDSSGGLTAGNYEFIDVVKPDSTRYFIDIDFPSEFAIARPTAHYDRVLKILPNVFVGKGEQLKQILRAMSDAARRSLKSRGLHIPPWRKNRFMQNKWLGPYRRTLNIFTTNMATTPAPKESCNVKCRAIGFDAVGNGRLFIAATTRTR